MKNPELFHKTIGILVNAYLNDTLEHNACSKCAVGNIITANMNYKVQSTNNEDFWVSEDGDVLYPNWSDVFVTYKNKWLKRIFKGKHGQNFTPSNMNEWISSWVKSTGYTLVELANIEHAFEIASEKGDYMFNGLMAVCDVLMQIHEATTEEITEAKALFVKA